LVLPALSGSILLCALALLISHRLRVKCSWWCECRRGAIASCCTLEILAVSVQHRTKKCAGTYATDT